MKYLPIFSFLLLIGACSSPGTNQAVITDQDEDILREFKTVLWPKAYNEQDTALLNRLLHDKFQMMDDNGDSFSKTDEIEYISDYAPSHDEFNYEITRLDLFDNGTAVVSGTGTMKGVEGAEAYITTYKSSNVLVKQNGQWKAISSHVSGVKEERFPMAPEE
ncbi:nuclear transport factor 2 family protein [Ekhidna sp.]|uniref:nuclear transport factor 2 family protein n=1 Tax=Ekhidna sp. TaxID=2608089 RepID=UPI003B5140B2